MSAGPSAPVSIGIDIGGTSSHGVVLDAGGRLLDEHTVPTGHGSGELLDRTGALVHELATRAGIRTLGSLAGVGIGVPGRVDPRAGVVETAVNLGVTSVALGPRLFGRLGLPVHVDNDVKATALGAARLLGAMSTSLTYVNFGTGVAAATVVEGRLLRGHANLAGEIGHLPLDPAGEPCGCGQRGCVETVLGGRYLGSRLDALVGGMTNEDLFASQDPAVRAERDRVVDAVVRTLIAVATAYGPHRIVVGGGVLRHTPGLLPAVDRALREVAARSPLLAALDVAGRTVALPSDLPAGPVGAAMLVPTTSPPRRAGDPEVA